MSYMSDATETLCDALGHCFAAYDDHHIVRTALTAPMDDVVIVDFSITACGIEVYGSVSIITGVIDWSGICFVSNFSTSSKRWLKHGPVRLGAPEFARELAAVFADLPGVAFVSPSKASTGAGFHFDLEAR